MRDHAGPGTQPTRATEARDGPTGNQGSRGHDGPLPPERGPVPCRAQDAHRERTDKRQRDDLHRADKAMTEVVMNGHGVGHGEVTPCRDADNDGGD